METEWVALHIQSGHADLLITWCIWVAMDARGVSITQLDSIDPTLVVYRAEATFVGVGLWDLYGVVVSTAAKGYWDKSHDDAILLEDVNGLTELWHTKTKPAWPAKYVHRL